MMAKATVLVYAAAVGGGAANAFVGWKLYRRLRN